MFEEQCTCVADLGALKGEFGLLTSATTTPGLLKAMLNVLYVRSVDVLRSPESLGSILMHRIIVLSMAAASLLTTVNVSYSAYGARAGLWVIPAIAQAPTNLNHGARFVSCFSIANLAIGLALDESQDHRAA